MAGPAHIVMIDLHHNKEKVVIMRALLRCGADLGVPFTCIFPACGHAAGISSTNSGPSIGNLQYSSRPVHNEGSKHNDVQLAWLRSD